MFHYRRRILRLCVWLLSCSDILCNGIVKYSRRGNVPHGFSRSLVKRAAIRVWAFETGLLLGFMPEFVWPRLRGKISERKDRQARAERKAALP
jgi:hypothetical protein